MAQRVKLKSFCVGVCATSVTWTILLYIYLNKYVDQIHHQKHHDDNHHNNNDNNAPAMVADIPLNNDVDLLGLVRNSDDEKTKQQGFKDFAFNLLISNRIGNNREIPDTRHEQ